MIVWQSMAQKGIQLTGFNKKNWSELSQSQFPHVAPAISVSDGLNEARNSWGVFLSVEGRHESKMTQKPFCLSSLLLFSFAQAVSVRVDCFSHPHPACAAQKQVAIYENVCSLVTPRFVWMFLWLNQTFEMVEPLTLCDWWSNEWRDWRQYDVHPGTTARGILLSLNLCLMFTYLPPPRRVCFVVGLFVCHQDYVKTTQWIS